MIQPTEMIVALGLFTAVAVSIKAVANAVLRYQETKLKYTSAPVPAFSDAHVERMNQAIDAIAIEVERIAENQRFLTKLLAEREDRFIAKG
jgi:hypothetical protein